MEIGSVSSSQLAATSANAQTQVRARQAEQDQQAQQTQQAQSRQANEGNESSARAQADVERNRPTVNANGQVVGTRVNTTA